MRLDSLYRTKSRIGKYDCSCTKNKITTNIKCNTQITVEPILSGTVLSSPLYLAVSCHLHQPFAVTLHWVPMGCFYRLPPVLYGQLKQDHSYIKLRIIFKAIFNPCFTPNFKVSSIFERDSLSRKLLKSWPLDDKKLMKRRTSLWEGKQNKTKASTEKKKGI